MSQRFMILLVSPVFLRSLWKYELKWDEDLQEVLCHEWNKIRSLNSEMTLSNKNSTFNWSSTYTRPDL